jgi:hypothetical protein
LKKDFKVTKERGEIDRMIEEAKEHGYHLNKEKSLSVLNEMFIERMKALQENKGSDFPWQAEQVGEIMMLLDLMKKWDFEISLDEAQNLMGQILEEGIKSLEKCWWGEGEQRPFHPSLIPLAEKLGFNVERFSKMVGSNPLTGRS